MPLREIGDINARCVACRLSFILSTHEDDSLDAVQDLMDHPTFESDFNDVAKGLPDLERIVSRIHANNCRVKDFLKVLDVSPVNHTLMKHIAYRYAQAFKRLSKGLGSLADTADGFKSKTILGLLRSAPDLWPHIKHVRAMFQHTEDGGYFSSPVYQDVC
jgi:DNA mismatch repair protein MSH6